MTTSSQTLSRTLPGLVRRRRPTDRRLARAWPWRRWPRCAASCRDTRRRCASTSGGVYLACPDCRVESPGWQLDTKAPRPRFAGRARPVCTLRVDHGRGSPVVGLALQAAVSRDRYTPADGFRRLVAPPAAAHARRRTRARAVRLVGPGPRRTVAPHAPAPSRAAGLTAPHAAPIVRATDGDGEVRGEVFRTSPRSSARPGVLMKRAWWGGPLLAVGTVSARPAHQLPRSRRAAAPC